MTKVDLQKALLKYYDNDTHKLKLLIKDLEFLYFHIGDNMDSIAKHNEVFMTLAMMSDFGYIRKLEECLTILKGKENG